MSTRIYAEVFFVIAKAIFCRETGLLLIVLDSLTEEQNAFALVWSIGLFAILMHSPSLVVAYFPEERLLPVNCQRKYFKL